MSDLPSKEFATLHMYAEMYPALQPVEQAVITEIERLQQDLARYENSRVVLTGEIDRLRRENEKLLETRTALCAHIRTADADLHALRAELEVEVARDRMARWALVMMEPQEQARASVTWPTKKL